MYDLNYQEEIVSVRYYNVIFYLKFKVNVDEFKKNYLVAKIESGAKMNMIEIYGWCKNHQIALHMKFFYRKDLPVKANAWNFYSYCRFRAETWIDGMTKILKVDKKA